MVSEGELKQTSIIMATPMPRDIRCYFLINEQQNIVSAGGE